MKKRIKKAKYCTTKINDYLYIVNLVITETKQMIEMIKRDMSYHRMHHSRHVVKKCRQSFNNFVARVTSDLQYLLDNDKIENTGAIKDFYESTIAKVNLAPDSNENKGRSTKTLAE